MKLITVQSVKVDSAATGEMVRRERIGKGITLREMARRLNLSAAYISDLELGRRAWTQEKLERFTGAMK